MGECKESRCEYWNVYLHDGINMEKGGFYRENHMMKKDIWNNFSKGTFVR